METTAHAPEGAFRLLGRTQAGSQIKDLSAASTDRDPSGEADWLLGMELARATL